MNMRMISKYNGEKERGVSFFKSAIVTLILSLFTFHSFAQVSSTNSTYSRFGLGLMNDQSQGFNKSMGGVGIGVRVGNRINTANPASYSGIDSLSLIFDVGMTASFGQMRQGAVQEGLGAQKVGVNGASLDYVHVGMHLARRLGLAAGFVPYTSIGYTYTLPEVTVSYNPNNGLPQKRIDSYTGSGGLNQAYIGLGWKPWRNLSVGANVGLLWGDYSHSVVSQFMEGNSSSDAYVNALKTYYSSPLTYKLDFGAQYPVRLTQQDWLSLGATFGLGHSIPQDVVIITDTQADTIASPFSLPYTCGFGAAWQHKNTLLVAADFRQEFWNACQLPDAMAMAGRFNNRTKIAVGTQWTPDPFDKRYWKRIQYRAGISYTTPYIKTEGKDGPYELSLGMGVGLPITNRLNNRSVVNFGLQWLRRSSSAVGMVKEDYLLINLGITFNERWFMKYKIE